MTDTDTKLDVPALINLIDTLVQAAPHGADTIRRCYYKNTAAINVYGATHAQVDTATPAHCIAGQVVFALGGEEALNKLAEDESIAPYAQTTEERTFATEGELGNEAVASEFLTPEAVRVLYDAQCYQDTNDWGVMAERIKEENTNV